MARYRPWTYANRQEVRDRGVKSFRNNALLRDEEEQQKQAPVTPFDAYRGAATSARPLEATGKKKSSLWGRAKGLAGDVIGEVGEAAGAVAMPVLETLDKPAQYTLRPAFGVISGMTEAEERTDPKTGQRFRRSGDVSLMDALKGWGKAITNPVDAYWEGKRGYEQWMADPGHSAGTRVLMGAVSDPLTYVGPGMVTKLARGAGLLNQGTRSAAVISKAAPWIESPKKAALGGALGAAAGAEAGERLGVGPAGQVGLSLAGGVIGASGLSMAAQRRFVPGMGGSVVDDASTPQKRPDIVRLKHADIKERPELFQARDVPEGMTTDPARVRQIVENFDPNQLEPGMVVYDTSTGDYIALRGHHRLEAQRQLSTAGRFPDEGTWEVIDADLSNPQHVKKLRELAATSNYTTAATNIREDIRTYRTLAETGNDHETIRGKLRKSSQAVDDLRYLSEMPQDVIDRLAVEPGLVGTAAEIARARSVYQLTEADVRGLWKRYGPGASEAVPRLELRKRLQEVGATLAERRAGRASSGTFGGEDWEQTNAHVIDAIDEMARIRAELTANHKRLMSIDGQLKSLEGDPGLAAEVKAVRDKLTARISEAQARMKAAEAAYATARKRRFETGEPGGPAGSGILGPHEQVDSAQQGTGRAAGSQPATGQWIAHGNRVGEVIDSQPGQIRVHFEDGSEQWLPTSPDMFGATPTYEIVERPAQQAGLDLEGGSKGQKIPGNQADFFPSGATGAKQASAPPARDLALARQPEAETPPLGAGRESIPDEEPEFGFRDTPPEGPPPPLDKRDDWRTLGLDPNKTYTAEEVKQAYRAQARRYHPDVNKAPSATEDMKAINGAFDRISGRSGAGPRTPGQRPDSGWWRAYREERARARSWRQEWEARRAEAQRQWEAGREERARARADLKAKERAFGAEPPRQEGGIPPGTPPPPKEPPMGVGKGGTEPFPEMGGEEGRIDILGTRTRAETLSRAERRAQQPLAKMGARLKSALGRLKSDDVRQKVDPVMRAKNEVDNRISHLPAWFMTRERAVMRESGLSVERGTDGAAHLLADGRDVGLFEDVVERVNDAGKAGYESLSDIQKDAVAVIKETNDAFNQTLKFHGVEPRIDPDIEGDYFGRRVAGRTVETEGGPQRIEKAEPVSPTQRVGATRTKSRVMESVEELQRLGFDLEDPWVTRMAVLRGKLLDARDGYLKNNLGPLAVKEPGSTFGLGSVNQPAFANMWFDADVAKAIEKGLAGPGTWAPKEALTAVNAVLTPLRASFDLSATLQQGMRMWLTNPKAAAEYWWTVMRSLKDPQIYDRALLKLDADGPGMQKLLTWGLRFTGETVEGEFFFPQGAIEKVGKAGVVGKGVNVGMKASNQHFGRTLNLYRVHFANNQYRRLAAAGLEGAELDDAMRSSMDGINRMFGWTGTKPTTLEQAALFAPRYFRASIETIEQAVKGVVTLGHASPEAAMARNHMALLLGEGAAAVWALNTLRGYETEMDPRSPNFLRLRNVGGLDVSPFGTYNTLFRAIAGAAAGGDYEDQPVKGRVGQLWRLVEGKMSPGMKLVYEPFVKGETYLGEPLDPLGDPVGALKEQAKSSLPFGVQNLFEEGPLAAGVGSFGVSSTPMTPAEKRDFAREDVAKEIFGRAYGDLKGSEKAQVNEQKKVAGHQAEVDRRALRTNTEFAKATQVRRQVEEELLVSAKYLAAGRDDAGKPYSGNDFRKAYNDTMTRAAGMRSMLKEFGGDDEVGAWFDLYDKATMGNGQVNYDALERLQAEFRAKHAGIDEKVEKVVGIHDNAAVRDLREAKKLARAYYQLPAYAGMNPVDAEHAGEVLAIANDMVAFGHARNQDEALRIIARTDALGAQLAKMAKKKGPNPARARFRKSQPLFAKYYSDVPVLAAAS